MEEAEKAVNEARIAVPVVEEEVAENDAPVDEAKASNEEE